MSPGGLGLSAPPVGLPGWASGPVGEPHVLREAIQNCDTRSLCQHPRGGVLWSFAGRCHAGELVVAKLQQLELKCGKRSGGRKSRGPGGAC